MTQLYPESSPPIMCPTCGQLNAGSSTVCVVCKTPLDPLSARPVRSWDEPAPDQRTAASLREHREIIAMYIRWCGYTTTIFGIILLLSPLLLFYGTLSAGSTLGIWVSGPIAAICLYILWQAPKVKKGLIRGETWPYDIIIRLHWGLYVVLGLPILGAFLLVAASPPDEEEVRPWVPMLCAVSPLVVGIIINWYAVQAFEWTIGRRDKLRRFTPLSHSGGRTTGVKVYTYLMVLYSGVIAVVIGLAIWGHLQKQPDALLSGIGRAVLAGLLFLATTVALAYGVWMRRAWGRSLAMTVHALIGVLLILLIVGAIPSTGRAGIAPYIGNFFINLAVFNWFYSHPEYFDR